jgi:hypothetical protein
MSRRIVVTLVTLGLGFVVAVAPAQASREVVRPGESIQAAVDAAAPGSTIVVLAGTYRENVTVTRDDIDIVGRGATLEPSQTPTPSPCFGVNGFCLLGDVDFDTGEVTDYVEDVTVSGFTVRGFSEIGIVAFGARDAEFLRNVAVDNGEYGLAAFDSTGTRMLFNRASGSGEAGLYVGDSPQANATLLGNETSGNLFGVFIRNALHGSLVVNRVHGNCLGVLVLADAPGPAGEFRLSANGIRDNTKACPPEEEELPAISGIGVALLGATGVTLHGNQITGNVPSGPSAVQGGVVVVSGDAGTPPTDNVVRGNVILRNDPDLFWDQTGTGNVFAPNVCDTSVPPGLCS